MPRRRLLRYAHRKRLFYGKNAIREPYRGTDPLGDVVSWNLKRRHLSVSQKSTLAIRLKPMFEVKAKENARGGQGGKFLRQICLKQTKDNPATSTARLRCPGAFRMRLNYSDGNGRESPAPGPPAGQSSVRPARQCAAKRSPPAPAPATDSARYSAAKGDPPPNPPRMRQDAHHATNRGAAVMPTPRRMDGAPGDCGYAPRDSGGHETGSRMPSRRR